MIDLPFYLQVGIFIFTLATVYFSLCALVYNLNQARKWYNIAQGYKKTIRMLAKELKQEEIDVLFSQFTIVEKDNEK
jgi:hypothetical protein